MLISCADSKDRARVEFFDLEGLVIQQIDLLKEINPSYRKIASINDKSEEKNGSLDSAGWAAELNIFLQSDINKNNLFDSYKKKEYKEDVNTTIEYTAKKATKVGIDYLKIHYERDRLKAIESLFTENNSLYFTRRKIKMNFEADKNNFPLLSGYKIDGNQKMVLKDTINYKIITEIFY